ncbi:MAG: S-adenosylmethionine:tRNA ribosyltransferase-isomerase, partial [Muribaculaceae bacterium]
DHPMHSEFIAVPLATIRNIANHLATGRSITAVGTTSVRTLESLYHIGCLMATDGWQGEVPQWYPYAADHPQMEVCDAFAALIHRLEADGLSALVAATRIIIAPGYQYRVVSGMITNFHQPRSTLLLLVSAFVGDDRWRSIYDHALSIADYRFLSYGDACYLRP